jgi:hypothetical protein
LNNFTLNLGSASMIAGVTGFRSPTIKPACMPNDATKSAGCSCQFGNGQSMIREGDRFDGLQELVDAAGMETAAVAFLDPRNPGNNYMPSTLAPGNGGEMVLLKPEEVSDVPRFVDTVRESPDVLTARASRTRLELASKAGVLDLGVDLAQTIKARNSFEKMIAHQLAALHCLAMNAVARGDDLTKLHKRFSRGSNVLDRGESKRHPCRSPRDYHDRRIRCP